MSLSAPRDDNRIPTLIGVDSTLFKTPTTIAVDPVTHAMLVEATITADSFREITGSASAQNADIVPSTDVSAYRSGSLQLTGTWSGAVTIQGSNTGNANDFNTVVLESADNGNLPVPVADTTGNNGIYKFPIQFRYIRIRATSYSSGTIVGTLELYPEPQDLWPVSSFGSDNNFIRGFGVEAATYVSTGGNSFDMLRTPRVFTPILAVTITNETTVWTPASGKKFRLMGFVITQTVVAGNITVRDGTAGSTILVIPSTPTGQPLSFPMGNGILSSNSNNVLTMQGSTGEVVSGFVYGTEE